MILIYAVTDPLQHQQSFITAASYLAAQRDIKIMILRYAVTDLLQHCQGFISAGALFRKLAPLLIV